ncbi:MAG: sigma 54-interacting transcriptional regulator [Acidobacteria bacterium]|nr:sigma 54-interacting transcriptional regulator [Acidobacteriota bacterium]
MATKKGAFLQVQSLPKAGLFETASGGLFFSTRSASCPLSLQAKFLKAVEERRIRRVGGTRDREIDVRIVAATSRDPQSMVNSGSFRADPILIA